MAEAFADPARRAGVASAFATALAEELDVDPAAGEITEISVSAQRRLSPRRDTGTVGRGPPERFFWV